MFASARDAGAAIYRRICALLLLAIIPRISNKLTVEKFTLPAVLKYEPRYFALMYAALWMCVSEGGEEYALVCVCVRVCLLECVHVCTYSVVECSWVPKDAE